MTTTTTDRHVFAGAVSFTGQVSAFPGSTISDTHIKPDAAIARSKLAEDSDSVYGVPFTSMRIHDAFQTSLPGTSSGNDLALIGGTFGTNSPTLQTADLKTAGATTNYARFLFTLPPEYVSAGSVTVRVHGGMKTTIAGVSATVDVECYKSDQSEGIGSDLCVTAAQSCNSLTLDDQDFVITSSGLVAGDTLDIRLALTVNDAATGTAVIGMIGAVSMLLDIKG